MSRKKNAVNEFLKVITEVEKKRLAKEFKEDVFNFLNAYIETLSLFEETMTNLVEAIKREKNEAHPENKKSDFELGLEMATVCSPGEAGKKKCRIYIRENPVDHGNIGDGKRYIPDEKSPAYVHVFDSSGKIVGFLNITGPRPQKESDVWEYRKPKNSKLDEYREDVVNWANTKETTDGIEIYNWTIVRQTWKNDHPKKPFRNVIGK